MLLNKVATGGMLYLHFAGPKNDRTRKNNGWEMPDLENDGPIR